IIGHRVWHVDSYCLLRSYVQSCWTWYPNSIFTAVPSNIDWIRNVIIGIHAWKTESQVETYIDFRNTGASLVIGTIWMWGDIIEHERGYRSSHAKIRSLDTFYNLSACEIYKVRKRYDIS
ncbi:MAG TPA: hypothetical protein VEP90_12340, partial [Methylomirabilota bacterium]|nr:hypothetical protein [Methylomirabilota bacterium]